MIPGSRNDTLDGKGSWGPILPMTDDELRAAGEDPAAVRARREADEEESEDDE